jgi:hypothetical protein
MIFDSSGNYAFPRDYSDKSKTSSRTTLKVFTGYLLTATILFVGQSLASAAPMVHQIQPGRPVKVAAIAIGSGGEHQQKLKLAMKHLETAGGNGVDIACLPEEFAGKTPEPIPGPTTKAVGEVAKKHRMYVVCPVCEQADGRQYNTAVLLDRQGEVAGYYRKVFVLPRPITGMPPRRSGPVRRAGAQHLSPLRDCCTVGAEGCMESRSREDCRRRSGRRFHRPNSTTRVRGS